MSTTLPNKFSVIFLLLLLFGLKAFADNPARIDSLKTLIAKTTADSALSSYYHQLADLQINSNPKQALIDINKSISLHKKVNKDSRPGARSLSKSTILRILGQIDSAIYYCNLVLNSSLIHKEAKLTALVYGELGLTSISQHNYLKAVEYFNKQIKVIKDNKLSNPESAVYNNLGISYANMNNWDMATEYFRRGLADDIKYNREKNLGNAYNNMGIVFIMRKQIDSAEKYLNKGVQFRIKQNDMLGYAGSINNLALLKKEKKDYKSALQLADSALVIAKRFGFKKVLEEVYGSFTEIYEAKGDFKNAYQSNKIRNDIKASFEKEELTNRIQDLEKNIELEQKNSQLLEKDLELEKTERQKQRQSGVILIGLVFIVGLTAFLYSFFKNNKILKNLNATISDQKNLIEEKHKDITDSIAYAHRIQSSLIPAVEEIKKQLPTVSILFKPRDIVSGDFYWYSKIKGKHVFALADCTGHGVPGAFMSIIGINQLNAIVNERELVSPEKILQELKTGVVKSLNANAEVSDKKDGMDIAVVTFDNHQLEFAGANQSILVLRNNELIELKGNKQPVGLSDKNDAFTNVTFKLEKGDRIILYSDGLVDQFGGKDGKKLKSKIVKSWLIESSNLERSEQLNLIESKLKEFMKGFGQTDDISLAIIDAQ